MKDQRYRLGVVSVSFRRHSVEEILEAAKDAGLTCIEWGSDVHAPCNDVEALRKIAALQTKYGIECSSYGTYFRLGETPIEELEHYIAAAKRLGTSVLRLWCGTKRGAEMTEQEKNTLLSLCRQAAEIAREHRVLLCMECHKNTFTESPADAVWLMDTVNSPSFRMYWQPFQWQSVEQNMENAKQIAPYAEHIHVFHWKDSEKLPLADATEVWQAYLQAICKPKILLLEFMPDGKLATLKREADALRSIIGENR